MKIVIDVEELLKEIEDIRQNYCSCEVNRSCITCEVIEEILLKINGEE